MPNKNKKLKILSKLFPNKKQAAAKKQRLELIVLATLLLIVVMAQVSGLYPYVYSYAKCGDKPLEVRGDYYKTPYDENYGIRPGSDYSRCFDHTPTDLQRDPSTKTGALLVKNARDKTDFSGIDGYTVYVPEGYSTTQLSKHQSGNGIETSYSVTADDVEFRVRVMKKDSDMSYTNLCSQSPTEKWSGEIVGKDNSGRTICRTHSFYVKDYVVGMNVGSTGIMLQTPLDRSVDELNSIATDLFNSMKPYTE